MIFAISALIIAIAMSINSIIHTIASHTRLKIFKCYELTRLGESSDDDEDNSEEEKEEVKEAIDYNCDEEKCSDSDSEYSYDISSPNTKRPTLSKPINIIEHYNKSSMF